MKAASDIRNIQMILKNEQFVKHDISELADKFVELIENYVKENIFSNHCIVGFYHNDEMYQKYYLDNFYLTISLLREELVKRGFLNVTVDEKDCGVCDICVEW